MEEEQKLKSLEEITDMDALRRYEKRRRILRILIVVLCVISAAGLIYGLVAQTPAPGEITVTLEVRYSTQANPFAYFVNIPAGGSLKDALLETGMITGEDGENGFVIRSIDGITADPANGQSWRITSYEEPVSGSPETVLIQEDTHFELILSPLL